LAARQSAYAISKGCRGTKLASIYDFKCMLGMHTTAILHSRFATRAALSGRFAAQEEFRQTEAEQSRAHAHVPNPYHLPQDN